MTTKISIIGIAKSGTSALYSSVKSALPGPRRLLFEPNNAAELAYVTAGNENALTKGMFGSLKRQEYDPERFTHCIAIVRDPRDIIISSTLFRFNRLKLINNKPLFGHLVSLFEKKEADPLSISVRDILEAAEPGEAEAMKDSFRTLLDSYSAYLDEGDHHVITFDQMVAGDFDALNAYIGLTLTPPPPLEGWVSKISRKGESGDWKNWFTPDDVAFFRDAVDPFIEKYGFDPEWQLEASSVIAPEHCSQYISRLSEARKVDPNLKKDVGSDMAALRSAAEDGKVNALMKLEEIYGGPSEDENPDLALEYSKQLAEMGYPKYLVKTARYLIKSKRHKQAYPYLEAGIAIKYLPAFFVLGNQYINHADVEKRAEGLAILERGRDLGGKSCATKLEALAGKDILGLQKPK